MRLSEELTTDFAPAERAIQTEIVGATALLSVNYLVRDICDAVSDMVVILNQHRQIVFCNTAFLGVLGGKELSQACGLRPGEVMGCVNSSKHAGGCGTSQNCSVCGVIKTIMVATEGMATTRECRILRNDGADALDLLAKSTPFHFAGHALVILAMSDISDRKRRIALERIFYHDILNTAFGVRLLSEYRTWSGKANGILQNIRKGILRLMEEVNSQRDLTAAEQGELVVKNSHLNSAELLMELADTWKTFAESRKCSLKINDTSENVSVVTDHRLLGRVLSNMIKNAVEASQPDDEIEVASHLVEDQVRFDVSGKAFIPQEHQLQIFQRSFSTKGSNRGLGTYSMKLLAERYLKGKVSFTSTEDNGTTFSVTLPCEKPE